eukprot:1366673-Amorphochlora_amoeboformis.AAC.1
MSTYAMVLVTNAGICTTTTNRSTCVHIFQTTSSTKELVASEPGPKRPRESSESPMNKSGKAYVSAHSHGASLAPISTYRCHFGYEYPGILYSPGDVQEMTGYKFNKTEKINNSFGFQNGGSAFEG